MNTNKIIYYNRDTNQASLDKENWSDIKGYGNYEDPYFVLNDDEDWCSIRTSKLKEWLICFAKEKNNFRYFQSFVKISDVVGDVVTFNCYQVEKNPLSGKWERVSEDKDNSFIF